MDGPDDTANPTSFAPLKAILNFIAGILEPEPADSLMEKGEAANVDPVASSNSTDRNRDSAASNSNATVELPNNNPDTSDWHSIGPQSASAAAPSWGINYCLAAQPKLPLSYEQRLYQHGHQKTLQSQPLIHFEALEGTNILFLEQQLMHFQDALNSVHRVGARVNMHQLGATLHQYSDAIRDAEYMRDHVSGVISLNVEELGKNSHAFPEIPYTSNCSSSKSIRELRPVTYDALRRWLKDSLPTWFTVSADEAKRRNQVDNKTKSPPKEISPQVERLARFVVAISGGLMLIVPMLIMRIHGDLVKSLVTTSLSVILFAATTSVLFKATDVNTLAATAAYTAVLVVFVGTSS